MKRSFVKYNILYEGYINITRLIARQLTEPRHVKFVSNIRSYTYQRKQQRKITLWVNREAHGRGENGTEVHELKCVWYATRTRRAGGAGTIWSSTAVPANHKCHTCAVSTPADLRKRTVRPSHFNYVDWKCRASATRQGICFWRQIFFLKNF